MGLNGKFKHFLVVEKKMAIQKQAFEEERQRYEEEIDGFRLKLTSANGKVDKLRRASASSPLLPTGTPNSISAIHHVSDTPSTAGGSSKVLRKRPSSASLNAGMATRPRASLARPSSAGNLR